MDYAISILDYSSSTYRYTGVIWTDDAGCLDGILASSVVIGESIIGDLIAGLAVTAKFFPQKIFRDTPTARNLVVD
jgi:hypothetical protein